MAPIFKPLLVSMCGECSLLLTDSESLQKEPDLDIHASSLKMKNFRVSVCVRVCMYIDQENMNNSNLSYPATEITVL